MVFVFGFMCVFLIVACICVRQLSRYNCMRAGESTVYPHRKHTNTIYYDRAARLPDSLNFTEIVFITVICMFGFLANPQNPKMVIKDSKVKSFHGHFGSSPPR